MSIKSIQARAKANKGTYVHYSQSEDPTATLIEMLPYTSDGICQALAAKWISEHANGGSLWNWLFKKGTTTVDPGKIANLMINFTESTVRSEKNIERRGLRRFAGVRKRVANRLANPTTRDADTKGTFYQDFVTDKYLGLYGIKRRGIMQACYAGSMGSRHKHGFGPKTGQQLGLILQPRYLNSKGGSYVLIRWDPLESTCRHASLSIL